MTTYQFSMLSLRTKLMITVAAILVFGVIASVGVANEAGSIRRFSLVAGANDGGPKRPILRYAHNDAKAIARVLEQLGGVARQDSVVLIEPDRYDFEAGLARLRERLRRAKKKGVRLEVLFYYSGHSDEQGLMLGDDLITYRELRQAIAELPADVRIAVLDSCSSGMLTRTKGGTRKAPFLMDTSVDVKGYAYLTSSSADESAQESDRVGGSFFTHYFVSGLRGAADTSKDNKVTLNEAYQYAFDETLARTQSTQAGPQHPSYDFQLKGSGDLVLTDLRGTSAALEFRHDLAGRIFIRNRKGQLVAEINKRPGIPVVLGLERGTYETTLEQGQSHSRGNVTISGGKTQFEPGNLASLDPETNVTRGGVIIEDTVDGGGEPASGEATVTTGITTVPFRVGLVPMVSTDMMIKGKKRNKFAINFIGWGDYLSGVEFSAMGSIRKENVDGFQYAGIFNFTRREVHGFQWAGMANLNGGATSGFMAGGLVNFVKGPFLGFQGAGVGNVNAQGSAHGFQGAGLFNFNLSGSEGFQGAGLLNVNYGFMRGAQISGLGNLAMKGESRGLQFSGIFNNVKSFDGLQLTGIANVAMGHLHGAQIGLVNYGTKVDGAQVGLVNVAGENNGATVGLVNVVGNGMFAPTVWASNNSLIDVGVKAGTRHVYSILGYGNHPVGSESERRDSFIAGVGGHVDLRPIWLELDLTTHFVRRTTVQRDATKMDFISKLRLSLGWRFVETMSIFVGPSLDFQLTEGDQPDGILVEFWSGTPQQGTNMELGLGFFGGLQFQPQFGKVNRQS